MTDNLDQLRHIEGFPKGKDEDLLALSNPPYYTAYPNPHIEDFIRQYGNPYDESTDDYHREPFVSDISEGKNDPIYMAHSYHTKVPYKAIMPFIENYTNPGDLVLDGFCGTGMVGVAALMAGRRAILSDLSPLATFIAHNCNYPTDSTIFEKVARKILDEVHKECGWMYETIHSNGQKGEIIYTIWSDVFLCPYCSKEIIYWDITVDDNDDEKKDLKCPYCGAAISRRELKRANKTVYDFVSNRDVVVSKQVPVRIFYRVGRARFEKKPDANDLRIINKIEETEVPYWFPSNLMMDKGDEWGDTWRAGIHSNIYRVDHFYTKRNLWILASIYAKINDSEKFLKFWFTSLQSRLHRMNRYMARHHRHVGPLSGTMYISSTPVEINVLDICEDKRNALVKASRLLSKNKNVMVTTQSSTNLPQIPHDSIDYIFTDPPFGDNLMYSELNFIWESWLKVFTNNKQEAIMSESQNKSLGNYRELMINAFSEMYRVLKPGRWITVEFHNSKASVWNAIQEGLSHAGFLVAQVTILDKQKGTTKQLSSSNAVKNDLVINAYKPRKGFTQRLISLEGQGLEADFVREHLVQVSLKPNIERSKEMLYSKYLAFYVQHGFQVIYNGDQFYRALAQWGLEERDGYWFADETQANQYEKLKVQTFGKLGLQQQSELFIGDERSARQWIWNFLDQPKTYDEIYTDFLKALQTSEDEIPEVRVILEESFVRTNGHWKRPDQLTQAELEKKRHERLLRQFEEYLNTARANQKLKEVRLEAVIAGFTECYRSGRYKDILLVGKKLDKGILENSSDLYDFIDIAEAKME